MITTVASLHSTDFGVWCVQHEPIDCLARGRQISEHDKHLIGVRYEGPEPNSCLVRGGRRCGMHLAEPIDTRQVRVAMVYPLVLVLRTTARS